MVVFCFATRVRLFNQLSFEIACRNFEDNNLRLIAKKLVRDSLDLMRFGKREINANPDGIDLGGAFLETLMAVGMLSRAAQMDPDSTGFKEGVRIYREMLPATPAYAVLTTPGNDRSDQIDAGRRWLRLNLMTTALGLSCTRLAKPCRSSRKWRRTTRKRIRCWPSRTIRSRCSVDWASVRR